MGTNITNKLAGKAAPVTGGVGGQGVRRFYSKTSQSESSRPGDGNNQPKETFMHAIIGITGNVGGATARALLKAGQKVRGIVRDKSKAAKWEAAGAELVLADVGDAASLEKGLEGVDGVFVMTPPYFAPKPGYPETKAIVRAIRQAVSAAKPSKAVYLSSVGAHLNSGLGLITQSHILEEEMGSLDVSNAFIRAAWFMDNFQWDVTAEREKGRMDSFLSPLDRAIPMVSAEDIGRLAAETLQQEWRGNRFLELEGPQRYSPLDAAEAFSHLLKRDVKAASVPRDQWAALFEQQGAPKDCIAPRIEMLDGFNSGLIDFEQRQAEHFKGRITLNDALRRLLERH